MIFRDDPDRLDRVLARSEALLRRALIRAARAAREELEREDVARLLAVGDQEALVSRFDAAAASVAAAFQAAVLESARSALREVERQTGAVLELDAYAEDLVRAVQQETARLQLGLTSVQRQALATAVRLSAGLPLERAARLALLSVGLNVQQVEQLARLERALEAPEDEGQPRRPSSAALAASSLAMLRQRAEVIATPEGQAAANLGLLEAFRQAVEADALEPDMVGRWGTRRDARVRDHHRSMEGQERPLGEPFVSGLGNRLRYPGDPMAPAEDRIRCRCHVRVTARAGARAPEAVA